MIKVLTERSKPVRNNLTVIRIEIDKEQVGRIAAVLFVLAGFLHFTAGVI